MRVAKQQTGLTLISFVFLLIFALTVLYLGIKIVPHYISYYSVRTAMISVSEESRQGDMSLREIQSRLNAKLTVNYVRNIGPDQIKVLRGGDGNILRVSYEVREGIVANLDACISFEYTVPLGKVN